MTDEIQMCFEASVEEKENFIHKYGAWKQNLIATKSHSDGSDYRRQK
jgi:hypothetical protein